MDEQLEDFFTDIFQINPVPLRFLPAPLKPVYIGSAVGFKVGTFGAEQEGRIAGGSMVDLFTPTIREYERSALVGLGGMRI
jgi:hypothetical protein